MTADIEAAEASDSMLPEDDDSGARVVTAHLTTAVVFFVFSLIGATIAALQLAVPGVVGGNSEARIRSKSTPGLRPLEATR